MVILHRRYLTLIEMVIVVTILILFTGVIGINIASAYRQQKFDSEVDVVVDRLRLAQNLMLVMNRDVDVIAEAKPNQGIELSLQVEGGLPEKWEPVMKNARYLLTSIHLFEFDDPALPAEASQVIFRFYSGGTVMSRGVIYLSANEDKSGPESLRKQICLKGYPHPIIAEREAECPEEQTEYDQRLTFYMVEELEKDGAS